jgi:hypothetical protein
MFDMDEPAPAREAVAIYTTTKGKNVIFVGPDRSPILNKRLLSWKAL